MATLVCFHAHPDDEAIATGGLMARAKHEGHRVVLVVATRGERGEVSEGFLREGEQLGIRRMEETFASAEVLGVDRVEFLGYVDSGMAGTDENRHPYAFCNVPIDRAAARLLAILEDEAADVLTIYDEIGGYRHPDHIAVHRVGAMVASLRPHLGVFESTMNRDAIRRSIESNRDRMEATDAGELPDLDSEDAFGMPEWRITHAVDVSAFTPQKRAAMRAHASQISEENFFLRMPDEMFVSAFGVEWFIRHGAQRPADDPMGTWLFD